MIDKQDYNEKWDGKTIVIDNNKYSIQTNVQEYGAMDFDEDRVAGDLVWRFVFARHHEIPFYTI